jgi:ubiquinone/menaquinone biosynthesis C-methylase UbiE
METSNTDRNVEVLQNELAAYIREDATVDWSDPGMPKSPIKEITPGLEANAYYFGHPEWAANYFKYCHRNKRFQSRWKAATGPWDDRIVVDIGCGPGNIFASVKGKPRLLIGVDVSEGGLRMAEKLGYRPLLADAHALPLKDGFADLVVLNATLHHCDHMEDVLREAARLVKPGGLLVSDHDPQHSAWNFKGIAWLLWQARLLIYRVIKKGFHRSGNEQSCVLTSEIHHDAGKGLTREMFHNILEPLGFEVQIHPHNHNLGSEVLDGNWGRSERKYRIAQWLSGVNPDSPAGALSLMCVARRVR